MRGTTIALLIAVLTFGMSACPDPQTGKVNPYLTARTVILQANTALALADGIFNQWLLGQTDAEKAKKANDIYQKTRTGVANSLQIALNGVAIAEQAKKDPDIKLLMAEANEAWGNLRKFLEDLLSKPEDAALVVLGPAKAAASQPTPTTPATVGGVSSTTHAVKVKRSPISALPEKLY
jgi:hypothetical protein